MLFYKNEQYGIVTLFVGLRSVRRFVSQMDEENQLQRLPVPA